MTFEAGKTYRTRAGRIAGPLRGNLSMMYVWAGEIEGSTVTWTADGAQQVNRRENNWLDLMPGAIEDEKPEAVDPRCVLQSQIDELTKRLHAQASTIAGMAAKIEEMQSSIDATINGVSKLYEDRADRAKPTIKGGWMNVYRNSRVTRIGALCSTREEAERAAQGDDDRIACIQIPDFTEGEGL